MAQYNKDQYFATLPDNELCAAVLQRVQDFFAFLKTSGRSRLYQTLYNAYYASVRSGARIGVAGNQNEYRNLNVNHYRSVLTTLKGLITQSKVAYDAMATNTDVKSQAQAILANGILQYYVKEKNIEQVDDQALEYAIALTEGWIGEFWDTNKGEVIDYHPDTNAPIFEGDVVARSYLPTQIVRDVTKQNILGNEWYIVIDFVNKYELAMDYPEHAERIKDVEFDWASNISPFFSARFQTQIECDDIPIYTLYHKPNKVVSGGKLAIILDDETTLFSGPTPYRELPVRPITTAEQIASNFGYSLATDLVPLQQMLNLIDSVITTNMAHYGIQNILVTKGSNIGASSIQGGLNLITWTPVQGGTPPQALQLLQTSPEVYNHRPSIINDMQLISGATAVPRGDMTVLGKSMSGSALALLQSMAVNYANSLQKSWITALSLQGTNIIKLLRDFGKTKRIAMITGISNRPYMKEFSGDDLSQVNRVHVDVGSAMSQTLAGRVDLAEKFVQQGWAKTPQEYVQVLNTGRLDTLIEGPQRINMQIRSENEDLTNGKGAIAVVTDPHVEHIKGHSFILDGLDARSDPDLVKRVTAHIQEHVELLKDTDAALLTILGQPVLQDPNQQQPMPEQQPEPGAEGMADMLDAQDPAQMAAQEVNMPNMPQPPQI